jgi:Protein of unknown function (DUF1997)
MSTHVCAVSLGLLLLVANCTAFIHTPALQLQAVRPVAFGGSGRVRCSRGSSVDPQTARSGRSLAMSSTIDEISPQLVAPAITAAIAEADQQLHTLAAPKHELFSYAENPPTVLWHAAARSKKRVKEGGRSLLAYLSLPPSQYSVLDARQIERISVDEFRCCPGALNFFGHHVSPVLYLRVRVDEGAARVSIDCTGVELEGSPAIRSASNSFTCECTNIVSSGPLEPSGKRVLQSEVDLRIEVKVPKENWIPLRVLRSTGMLVQLH